MRKHSPKVFEDNLNLPASYLGTNLTLMTRDPHWVYAYWEIAPSRLEDLRRIIGDELDRSSRVLRMYNVTYINFNGNNANNWFDIDVGPHAANWYVNLWQDNATYCGEIGMRKSDGSFFALARSNFVTTPRANQSNRTDMIWMEVKPDKKPEPFIVAAIPGQEPKASSSNYPAPRVKNPKRKIFLTENDIKIYYSKLFPLFRQIISTRYRKQFHKSTDSDILFDYNIIQGLSRNQIIRKIMLGASEELVLKEGASKGGASEREHKKRKFYFDIGTELIVYGRTEPDAEVCIGDKPVKLRSDGTFTLRFALPDGEISLDFTARSSDGKEKREIKTSVNRAKTKYNP